MIKTSCNGGNPLKTSTSGLKINFLVNKGSICRYFNIFLVRFETFAGGRDSQRTCSDVVKMDAAVIRS